ncbi:MAG TPA: NahK/ErcS family hybrid sensor histidine kinase/response regulator [Rhodanobacter sp.]
MNPRRHPRIIPLIALLAAIAASACAAGWWAQKRVLAQLSTQAAEQLQVRALALQRLIDRYRVLPTVLALDPELRSALSGHSPTLGVEALNHKLEQANGATHVSTLTLIDRRGVAIAASNWREPSSNVGLDYTFRPYFQLAMRQDHGTFYGIGVSTNVAGYFIAEALHDNDGQRIGAIVVKITLDTLEQEWEASEDTILLSDQHDIVFLGNHADWMYHTLYPLEPAVAAALAGTRQYDGRALQPSAFRIMSTLADGGQRVQVSRPPLPRDVIWQSMPLPAQRWTLHLLRDTRPAMTAAYHAALVTLGGWLPLALLGLFLQQRLRLASVRQRSREELERLVAHYASALRSEQDSLVQAALQAGRGHSNVLERLPQGVSVVDAQLRLVAWNQRYAEIFRFPGELLQAGRPIEDLFRYNANRGLLGPGDIEESIQRRLDYLRRGGPHMYERERPDDSVLEIRGNPLPDGGFVTSYADITAYKDAARELRTLTSTLEDRIEKSTHDLRIAKAEAEHAHRNKTRYVAAAVHDLLQPLNAARLFAGALRDTPRGVTERDLVERVEHALQALDSQLISMLDLSRLDAGALRPTIEAFALSPLLQGLARQFGIIAQARGLALSFVDTRVWVRSDATLLRRVLQNFLSNALHYTPQGRVLLGCRRQGDAVRIEIWDTGVGVTEDQRQIIFQEFRRLDTGLDSDERSAGLGLSIVERIAALLEHPLQLRSWPGRGSVFSVNVPLAAAQAMTVEAPTADSEQDSPLVGRTVCCIDDDPDVLLATTTLLRGWGCVIQAAGSAEQALERAPGSAVPDLVLLDYQLGERTGLDLLPELVRQWQCSPPVIVLTAQVDAETQAKIRAAGLRFMAKPASPARLRALMSQLLMARSGT